MMKVLYRLVTFAASVSMMLFISWEVYMQWPQIEATAKDVIQHVKPVAQKKCECGPRCPEGGCADCKCKQCCHPGH